MRTITEHHQAGIEPPMAKWGLSPPVSFFFFFFSFNSPLKNLYFSHFAFIRNWLYLYLPLPSSNPFKRANSKRVSWWTPTKSWIGNPQKKNQINSKQISIFLNVIDISILIEYWHFSVVVLAYQMIICIKDRISLSSMLISVTHF